MKPLDLRVLTRQVFSMDRNTGAAMLLYVLIHRGFRGEPSQRLCPTCDWKLPLHLALQITLQAQDTASARAARAEASRCASQPRSSRRWEAWPTTTSSRRREARLLNLIALTRGLAAQRGAPSLIKRRDTQRSELAPCSTAATTACATAWTSVRLSGCLIWRLPACESNCPRCTPAC